jgi:AcrR family transcriptional regulator
MSRDPDSVRERRQLVLAVAAQVFLEHGITAPLDLVVERSGVGRATLYRNFPDRAALVLALAHAALDRMDASIRALPTPASLTDALHAASAELIENPALVDGWRVIDRDSAPMRALRLRAIGLFDAALAADVAAGIVRADITPDDIQLVLGMLGAVVREPRIEARQAMITRMIGLLCLGILRRGPRAP